MACSLTRVERRMPVDKHLQFKSKVYSKELSKLKTKKTRLLTMKTKTVY
jgi:hypothetical protein